MTHDRRSRFVRRASAVVETAVVAPLLVTAMFGILELGQAYNIKQTLSLAAREGCRAAALPGGTMTDAQTAVNQVMAMGNLTGYTTTSNISSMTAADSQVWVQVSLPFNRATFTGSLLGGGSYTISSKTTMRREGVPAGTPGGAGGD